MECLMYKFRVRDTVDRFAEEGIKVCRLLSTICSLRLCVRIVSIRMLLTLYTLEYVKLAVIRTVPSSVQYRLAGPSLQRCRMRSLRPLSSQS